MSRHDDPQDPELAALYRASAQETTPEGLDARILAAARATATQPAAAAVRPAGAWIQRWRVPFAVAATVLMATTLTLMVREQDAGLVAPVPEIVPGGPPAAKAPPQGAAPETKAPPAAPATIAPPLAPRPDAGSARESESPRRAPLRDQAAPTPADTAPGLAKERAQPDKAEAQPEPVPAEQRAKAVAQPAPATTAGAAARADRAVRSEALGALARSPESWLEDIRRLRREGRTAEAEASLAQFRQRYPDYTLPDDLKQP